MWMLWVGCMSVQAEPEGPSYEVAGQMHAFQVHAEKLWWAGRAQNWRLAEFYVDELEEGAKSLDAAAVIEDGYPLSNGVRKFFLPAQKRVEKAVHAKDLIVFKEAYDGLVGSCNACHVAAHHEFIVITSPTTPMSSWSNQDFAPRPE